MKGFDHKASGSLSYSPTLNGASGPERGVPVKVSRESGGPPKFTSLRWDWKSKYANQIKNRYFHAVSMAGVPFSRA